MIDESMISYQGRCKFRVRIPRKPINIGIKVWTLADNLNYVYSWEMFKGVKEKVSQTMEKMTSELEINENNWRQYHIYADSFFGSEQVAKRLINCGVRFSLCCQKNRPSYLFDQGLHKNLEKGKWKSRKKIIDGVEVIATSFKDKHRKNRTIVNLLTDSVDDLIIKKNSKMKPRNIE